MSTWTNSSNQNWAESFLPFDFPQARIMTYGYDADVVRLWTNASANRLRDHGKSLAASLIDRRSTEDTKHCPIIFVVHSLGGLVCEQAFLLSRDLEEWKPLHESTRGIIFMGTPHGGSPHANWGSTLAKWLNFIRRTNVGIVQDLSRESEILQAIEEDFQILLKNARHPPSIHCFYEAFPMTTAGKIVEDDSARLLGYGNNSIQANHVGMTKFGSRSDEGYQLVIGVLRRWINNLANEAQTPKQGGAEKITSKPEREEQARQAPTASSSAGSYKFYNDGATLYKSAQGLSSAGGAINISFG
jgi:pimeloyl-ACP methyl ester carboxylesterase